MYTDILGTVNTVTMCITCWYMVADKKRSQNPGQLTQSSNPSDSPTKTIASWQNKRGLKSPLERPTTVLLLCLFSMVYCLSEAVISGPPTGLRILNIGIGVGAFFFVLVASFIGNLFAAILETQRMAMDADRLTQQLVMEVATAQLELEKAKAKAFTGTE